MIKKLTITSFTALSLLLVTAQAEGMKCQAGKCGAGMMKKTAKKVESKTDEKTEKDENKTIEKKEKMKGMKCAAGKCGSK